MTTIPTTYAIMTHNVSASRGDMWRCIQDDISRDIRRNFWSTQPSVTSVRIVRTNEYPEASLKTHLHHFQVSTNWSMKRNSRGQVFRTDGLMIVIRQSKITNRQFTYWLRHRWIPRKHFVSSVRVWLSTSFSQKKLDFLCPPRGPFLLDQS